jgi:hypothetical protein
MHGQTLPMGVICFPEDAVAEKKHCFFLSLIFLVKLSLNPFGAKWFYMYHLL